MPPAAAIIGGSAVVGGVTSYLGSRKQADAATQASAMQLQAAREAIAAQKAGSNKALNFYKSYFKSSSSSYKGAQNALTSGYNQARADINALNPYLDPNSALANQERGVFSKTLANNLSARGLQGSGLESAGLSNFELGLAEQRRNLAFQMQSTKSNLANTYGINLSGVRQNLGQLQSNFGAGSAGILSNIGNFKANTLTNLGVNQGNLMQSQAAATAQGYAGMNNALQLGASGIAGVYQANAANVSADKRYTQMFDLLSRNKNQEPNMTDFFNFMNTY